MVGVRAVPAARLKTIEDVFACLHAYVWDAFRAPYEARVLHYFRLIFQRGRQARRRQCVAHGARRYSGGRCDLPGTTSIGHPSGRRDHVPSKITVQSGAKRHSKDTSAASALDVTLLGSRLERREDCRSRASALGGRYGGRPGAGLCAGSARAAARRAPEGAKAELPVWLR